MQDLKVNRKGKSGIAAAAIVSEGDGGSASTHEPAGLMAPGDRARGGTAAEEAIGKRKRGKAAGDDRNPDTGMSASAAKRAAESLARKKQSRAKATPTE